MTGSAAKKSGGMTMTDELVKRLRTSWDTQRSIMLQTDAWMTERHQVADRIEALTAERDRLWEALMDAREAWDNHMEYGEPMQGWWIADARAALNAGKEPSNE